MSNQIKLNPEVVRLAQLRARSIGSNLKLELARALVQESVLQLDPELGYMLDESAALSSGDGLACALGANDIVVNDRHIDVRVLEDDGTITMIRALVGTSYLTLGSVVVKLDDNHSGCVIGYIGPGAWLSAEQKFNKEQVVQLEFEVPAQFDFAASLFELCNRAIVQIGVSEKSLPDADELSVLLDNREKLIVARQKQIVSALVTNAPLLQQAKELGEQTVSKNTQRALNSASLWSGRVESFADAVAPKFPSLTREQVCARIRKTGEVFGGQTDAPSFRREVLSHLTKEQLMRKFAGANQTKVAAVIDNVMSGRSAADCVKDLVKSKVAVDLAAAIKHSRARVEEFVAASAEEIGAALKTLALQPSYATHSTEAEGGIEAINEALQLLEVGEMAEQIKQLDQELTVK
ncbi:MAG TPA: hypothetical protein V6C81_23390 [Planktothrix sp.]|jgi:hypothetical protein